MYQFKMNQFLLPDDFFLPFEGKLNKSNKWVRMAQIIPWHELEERYAQNFSNDAQGNQPYSVRMAFGAIFISQYRKLTDRELVEEIPENIYYQYFLGLPGYQEKSPFDASLMVHFRKRFSAQTINEINELIVREMSSKNDSDKNSGGSSGEVGPIKSSPDEGTEQIRLGELLLDATCVPADIHFPTDVRLLNSAREALETVLDVLHQPDSGQCIKPRDRRETARRDYLSHSKKKRPGLKATKKAIKKQLQFVRRDLLLIQRYADRLALLSRQQYRNLLVSAEIYRQQAWMYRNPGKSVEDRIVNLSQPHIRPIVRGKAGAQTEFGAKLEISVVNGFAFSERISFNSYNEGTGMKESLERFKIRFGYYPEAVIADKIYRNRNNWQLCKSLGIRLSGPRLGRPVHDEAEQKEQKHQERKDARIRNAVEGKFGEAKRKYGLGRVYAKLAQTTETVISVNLLVMNLERMLRILYALFSRYRVLLVYGT